MKLKSKRIISPLKIFGGKFYQFKNIIPLLEYNNVFVEGYCATAVVSLNLDEKFDHHLCFDSNRYIINFWKILQDQPVRLRNFLTHTEYSEENFERAKEHVRLHEDEAGEPFFDAAMYFIANRMSRSADMETFGWSDRLRRGMPEYISAYLTAIDNLGYVSGNIQEIDFKHGKYIDLMIELDLKKCKNLSQYLDPPYMPETRVSKNSYGKHEMSQEEHAKLLHFIKECKGTTYISGYNSSLYTTALAGYEKYSWKIANSSSQAKVKPIKEEVLWKVG